MADWTKRSWTEGEVDKMASAAELISDPYIAEWTRSHEGCVEQVRKAAEILADKPDGPEALKKLLPALRDKVVHVFFSYKTKEDRTASEVVNLLRKNSAGKLKITYQAEFTKEITGRQWRQKIRDEICRANWFILLLPHPSDDWDWCLYEAGLFDRQANSGDRLFCLHHPDTSIPDPIKDYHHVPATVPKMEEFLRMVYLEDNPIPGLPPLNQYANDAISELASKIVDAIHPPAGRVFQRVYEPWVALAIDNADRLAGKDELDKATVESTNQEALRLFDFAEQPRTWGELRRDIVEAQGDSRWREEMFHVIRRIAQGRRFHPIQSVFQANNGQIYRPVVHAIDRLGQCGPILRFHITFTEDIAAIDSSAMPLELSKLATVFRFAFRFRWEVLEKFGGRPMAVEDVERLDNAFRRMKKDWESRGVGGTIQILDLFPGDKRQSLLDMFVAWGEARNKDGRGDLDVAIVNRDPEACSKILKRFIPMNQEFLEMVADRFSELISGQTVRKGSWASLHQTDCVAVG
jgi:hypothetical protein